MAACEKLGIQALRKMNLNILNVGDGGERIGSGYTAFLYLCHDDHCNTPSCNGLMRFSPAKCGCKSAIKH